MEIGVLYLSHATVVLAELIVFSTKGFACILAKLLWPTVKFVLFVLALDHIGNVFLYFGHRNLDLKFVHGRAEK